MFNDFLWLFLLAYLIISAKFLLDITEYVCFTFDGFFLTHLLHDKILSIYFLAYLISSPIYFLKSGYHISVSYTYLNSTQLYLLEHV